MPAQRRASRWLMALLLLLLGSRASVLLSQEKSAGGVPYRADADVSRPERISGDPPVYTEEARKAQVKGAVVVEAIIDERGDVTDVRVLQGLPMGLDQAAVEAVRTWKFKPAMQRGKPVKVYYVLKVNFRLDETPRFGPVFQGFLQKNPDFAAHLNAERYPDATALLDRWSAERPKDSDIPLARVYLFVEQGRLFTAWKLARAVRGPSSFEACHRVGTAVLNHARFNPLLTPEARGQMIDIGVKAETLAMEARKDAPEAPLYKSLLLSEKAKLTSDPGKRQTLLDEARRLMNLHLELKKLPQPEAGEQQ